MQDLLQGFQNAREIVASSPLVLQALHQRLMQLESPLERAMLLRNLNFNITRQAPGGGRRRSSTPTNFERYRQVRTKAKYV